MISEVLAYGLEILAKLDTKKEFSLAELEEISEIKGDDLKELLNYLENFLILNKPN